MCMSGSSKITRPFHLLPQPPKLPQVRTFRLSQTKNIFGIQHTKIRIRTNESLGVELCLKHFLSELLSVCIEVQMGHFFQLPS